MATTPSRMIQRRRTFAQWTAENPVLASGEIGIATGTQPLLKVGDGTTTWNNLKNVLTHTAEDIAFSVAEMHSLGTAINTASSFPRFTLPDGATTSVFIGGFNMPSWYKAIDIHFGFVNDHSAAGDVRWRTILREVDVGEAVTAGTVIHDVSMTIPAGGAGGLGVGQTATSVTFNPGGFGQVYGFEIQRIGGDGADTLAGPVGLVAVGFGRIDI
jgi:Major tropism determinant N-terminal domain